MPVIIGQDQQYYRKVRLYKIIINYTLLFPKTLHDNYNFKQFRYSVVSMVFYYLVVMLLSLELVDMLLLVRCFMIGLERPMIREISSQSGGHVMVLNY